MKTRMPQPPTIDATRQALAILRDYVTAHRSRDTGIEFGHYAQELSSLGSYIERLATTTGPQNYRWKV